MYFCLCRGLTESDVEEARITCAESKAALISALGLRDSRCCGRCVEDLFRPAPRERDLVYVVGAGVCSPGEAASGS
jgi:bacterioferritin-associated ferredoxin